MQGGLKKAKEIEVKIRDMDLDKNRTLTYEELMVLFKEVYGDHLKSLMKVLSPLSSVQNHNLIHYEMLLNRIKLIIISSTLKTPSAA